MFLSPRITGCVVLAATLASLARAEDDTTRPEAPRAFRPVVRPVPPMCSGIARTAVDRFILAAAEIKGLTLSPEADRATLIRRVCFDLTGLPPTVTELDAFLQDHAPDAYERMVERYLASPRYGERWGKPPATPTATATSTPTATGPWPGNTGTMSSGASTRTGPTTGSYENNSRATSLSVTVRART